MADALFWVAMYLAAGALYGQFHLHRCASCSERFEPFGSWAKYVGASALFAVPGLVWGFVVYVVGECDEDNGG